MSGLVSHVQWSWQMGRARRVWMARGSDALGRTHEPRRAGRAG